MTPRPTTRARRRLRAAAVAIGMSAAVVLSGCGGAEPDVRGAGDGPGGSATSTPPETTTTTLATTTTTAPPEPGPVEPTPDDIALLQFTLGTLGYFNTDPVGTYGAGTRNAVMAFQKLHGLQRDGIAGPLTLDALSTATPAEPRLGRHPHVEVDLEAQVTIVVDHAGMVTVVNATTGAAATPTPPGQYRIFRQVDGWDPGPYGALYRPKYFTGGIAFHGGVPILAHRASHGCVRLPDPAVDWLWDTDMGAIGTTVDVY